MQYDFQFVDYSNDGSNSVIVTFGGFEFHLYVSRDGNVDEILVNKPDDEIEHFFDVRELRGIYLKDGDNFIEVSDLIYDIESNYPSYAEKMQQEINNQRLHEQSFMGGRL